MIDIPDTIPQWIRKRLQDSAVADGDCLLWQGWMAGSAPMVVHPHWKELGRSHKGVALRREMYTAMRGRPPQRTMKCMSSCGDPRCVAPGHIVQRSQASMMAAVAERVDYKLRATKIASTRQRNSRLTQADVEAIRAADTAKEAAERYGISLSYASAIRTGRAWRPTDVWSSVFMRLAA